MDTRQPKGSGAWLKLAKQDRDWIATLLEERYRASVGESRQKPDKPTCTAILRGVYDQLLAKDIPLSYTNLMEYFLSRLDRYQKRVQKDFGRQQVSEKLLEAASSKDVLKTKKRTPPDEPARLCGVWLEGFQPSENGFSAILHHDNFELGQIEFHDDEFSFIPEPEKAMMRKILKILSESANSYYHKKFLNAPQKTERLPTFLRRLGELQQLKNLYLAQRQKQNGQNPLLFLPDWNLGSSTPPPWKEIVFPASEKDCQSLLAAKGKKSILFRQPNDFWIN